MRKIVGVTVGTTMPRSNLEQTDPKKADYVRGKEALEERFKDIDDKIALTREFAREQTRVLNDKITAMQQGIADLQYVPIDITAVSNNVGTVEIGVTVEEVTISWAANKQPTGQDVNGEQVETDVRELTLTGLNLTEDTSFTVFAVDERGATDEDATWVRFLNGIYYGVLDYGTEITSEVILGLTKKLKSGRAVDFSVREKRPTYACPSRYGRPGFQIGGFAYDWEKVSTFDFTNASGYTESYDVWMHGQDAAGSMTIHVT